MNTVLSGWLGLKSIWLTGPPKISVGSKVKVYDNEFEEEVEYVIVGSAEADPMENKISNESPVGHGLLGHVVGDDVVIETPDGEISFKVLAISK